MVAIGAKPTVLVRSVGWLLQTLCGGCTCKVLSELTVDMKQTQHNKLGNGTQGATLAPLSLCWWRYKIFRHQQSALFYYAQQICIRSCAIVVFRWSTFSSALISRVSLSQFLRH